MSLSGALPIASFRLSNPDPVRRLFHLPNKMWTARFEALFIQTRPHEEPTSFTTALNWIQLHVPQNFKVREDTTGVILTLPPGGAVDIGFTFSFMNSLYCAHQPAGFPLYTVTLAEAVELTELDENFSPVSSMRLPETEAAIFPNVDHEAIRYLRAGLTHIRANGRSDCVFR
ncbi:MAG: hypothetical protein HC902_03375 [Calothrix sp. SM1_5_4]|nr:hypothetical protein [Calothrix sp. SM1_5_4]